ncbi:MAG: hypothetical protein ACTS45_01760 [Candidatus Hodgkinia cicadicola]
MFKLNHMVEGKMYYRLTGPYSPLSEQPTKGKASNGGKEWGWKCELYKVMVQPSLWKKQRRSDVMMLHSVPSSRKW